MTMQEIAARAGVSRGTVDRVIKNRGGVNRETEERVRAVLKESGYVPNRAGVALVRSRRPMVVGVITNSVGNPFFDEVNAGVEEALAEYREYGFSVLRKEIKGYDLKEQIAAMGELFSKVDGLLLTPIDDKSVVEEIGRYAEQGKPVVTVTGDVAGSRRAQYVGCDYFKSGQAAAQLALIATGGAGKVAIVTGSFKVLGHNERIRGFRSVADSAALNVCGTLECNDDDATAFKKTRELLLEIPDINVLYVAAAGVAGAVEGATAAGANPYIIVNDLIPATREYLQDGKVLAAIDQQPARQGYIAAKNVFGLLLGSPVSSDRFYTDLSIRMKYNV